MTPKTQQTSYSLDEVMEMYGTSQPNIQPTIQAAQETSNPYNAVFRATGEEGGIKSGLKALGNTPTSAFTLGKNIVSAITSPVQTAKAIGGAVTDIGRTVTNKLTDVTGIGQKQETPTLSALTGAYKDRYGSLENAQKTAIEDPFGVGSDILGVLTGAAGAVGKGAAASKLIGKVGGAVTSPLARTASGFSEKVAKTARFGVSQATGLSPDTISTIAKNGKSFTAAQKAGISRTDLAENVLDAVNKAGDELSDLGAGYDDIRAVQTDVALPQTWLQDSLNKYGLKFQNTKVSADKASATRNVTDLNKIQEFIDNWGDSRTLTPEEYLNMRHDLAELAKYEVASGKSSVVQKFAQDVREGVLNADNVRNQVPGLKELDTKYAADRTFFKQMEKDFINKQTGGLKDGAASKVVNAINAANPERLARLEKLYPGFTKQAKVIKAIEDVEAATGAKTGTYVRAGVIGGAAVTGNLPLVVTAILSTPEIAVPLIKGYGWTADQIAPVLQVAKEAASDINNFRVPGAVEQYLKEKYPDGVPAGMSIRKTVTPESVAKKSAPEDIKFLNAVIDDVKAAKIDPEANKILDAMGLGKATDDELVSFAKEVINENDIARNLEYKGTPQTTALLEESSLTVEVLGEIINSKKLRDLASKEIEVGNKTSSINTRLSQWQASGDNLNELVEIFKTKDGIDYLNEIKKSLPDKLTVYRVGNVDKPFFSVTSDKKVAEDIAKFGIKYIDSNQAKQPIQSVEINKNDIIGAGAWTEAEFIVPKDIWKQANETKP